MKKIAVWIGNGCIGIASEEDLEVAFIDADGERIEIVEADPERMNEMFSRCLLAQQLKDA